MNSFKMFHSKAVLLLEDDVDTDQIIPARYLKVTDKAGLGSALFADWRYLPDGSPKPDFPLNRAENQGAEILVAGRNFGCGSSREHAPWALIGAGFKVVISTSFADIFRNNSLKNGFLPVALAQEDYQQLLRSLKEQPDTPLGIDLANQAVVLPDESSFSFTIDDFSKACLLNGVDELGYLLALEEDIAAYESRPVFDAAGPDTQEALMGSFD
jgi:3-isopropylmalate/(R)-2-methylmalate dehydratase small subunit